MSDTLTAIRSKYPQYADMDDQTLVSAVAAKYPVYLKQDPGFAAEAAGRVLFNERSPTMKGLRAKYPQYGDMSDFDLAKSVDAKYPDYARQDPEFAAEARGGAGKVMEEQASAGSGKLEDLRRGVGVPAGDASVDLQNKVADLEKFMGSEERVGDARYQSIWETANTPLSELVTGKTLEEHVRASRELAIRKEHPDWNEAQVQQQLSGGTTAAGRINEGLHRGVEEMVDSFLTPLGIATFGLGALPKSVQKSIALAFGVQAVTQVPKSAKELVTAIKSGDKEEIARAAVGTGANTILAGVMVHHGLTSDTSGEGSIWKPRTDLDETGSFAGRAAAAAIADSKRHPLLRGADAVEQASRDVVAAGKMPKANVAAALANVRAQIDEVRLNLAAASQRPSEAAIEAQQNAQFALGLVDESLKRARNMAETQPDHPELPVATADLSEKLGALAQQMVKYHFAQQTGGDQNATEEGSKQENTGAKRAGNGAGGAPGERGVGGGVPTATQQPAAVAAEVSRIAALPVEEQNTYFSSGKRGVVDNPAYRLGLSVQAPEDVKALEDAFFSASRKARIAMKAGDPAAAMWINASQGFREAHEAATGTGSAGTTLRANVADYKPKFPLPEDQGVLARRDAESKGGEQNVIQQNQGRLQTEEGNVGQNVSRKPGDENALGTPGVPTVEGQTETGGPANVTVKASRSAAGLGGTERPPDVLDFIDEIGARKISLKFARQVIPGFKPSRLARKYFTNEGGAHPSTVLSHLQRENRMLHLEPEQDQELLEEMNAAGAGRVAARAKAGKETRALNQEAKEVAQFEKVVVAGQRPKWDWREPVQVPVGDLLPGDKFEVMGHQFTVSAQEFDNEGFMTSVTVKDGPKFGVRQIDPARTEVIHVDEDSYVKAGGNLPTPAQQAAVAAAPGEAGSAGSAQPAPPSEDPDWTVEGVVPADFVGMGNALYNEVSQPGSYVSNMFAAIDADRAAMGKEPMPETKSRSWDKDNARALAKMNREPGWIPNLIDAVTEHPRPLLSWENAGMVWHRAKLKAELNNAFTRINRAFEDGREADQQEARAYAAKLEDDLQKLDEAVGRNGTGSEAGRSLNAQKMAGNTSDFSLVEMRLETRAAKGGAPLTPEEETEVARLHAEIAAKQAALDKYVAESEEKLRQAGIERQMAQARAEAAERGGDIHPKVLAYAKEIVAKLDSRAAAARIRLREKLGRVSAGVDPTILGDLAEIGASHLAHNLVDFAEWSAKMVADVGEWIRPNLREVREASDELFGRTLQKGPEGIKRVFSKTQTPMEVRTAAKGAMLDKVKEAQRTGRNAAAAKRQLTYYVQRIFKSFVSDGLTRDAAVDAVHGVLKDVLPDISKSDTIDAISGYGDWKQLPKDWLSVRVREYKGELLEIRKLEDMAAGKPPLKSGVARGEVSEARRKLIQKVNAAKREFQVPISDPETQLASALDTYKKVLARRAADYEERLARGDFVKTPRKELTLDHKALELRAAAEAAKRKFQKGLQNYLAANRTMGAKLRDYWVKFRRAQLLSSPLTLAKLTAASAERIAFTPIEEAVGAGWSAMLPGLASKAAREGGFNVRAESRAITDGLVRGIKEIGKVTRTGKSTIDEAYGTERDYPVDMIGMLGRLHQALKQPAKMAEFERSYYKRTASLMAAGVDVTDPMVKLRLMKEAYEDSNRAIFSQDNLFVKRLRLALHEGPNAGFWQKTLHLVGNTLFPIVRIPTNLVGEAFTYALGIPAEGVRLGSRELRRALGHEVAELTPQEADLVMRHLKKGTLGAAVMLAGYFMPQFAGGFYSPGEKRRPGDPRWGSVVIGGHQIPSYLLDNPLIMVFQLGATIRHVQDSRQTKRSPTTRGLTTGAMAGALAMADQAPFIRETADMAKAFNIQEQSQFFGELGKSLIVPQLLQQIAKWQDKETREGSGYVRAPDTAFERFETGVPFLRERVKLKASVDNQ